MALIEIEAVESIRFSAPDLSVMRQFLIDFGMTDAASSTDGILRMRGSGNAAFVHETIEGDPGFVGVALRASCIADLETMAREEGVNIRPASGPGGGSMISLRDPDGYLVEVVAGRTPGSLIPSSARDAWNTIHAQTRHGEPKRLASGPANVVRIGHVVLGVSNTQATWDWWQARFGLIMSDEVRAPDGTLAAAFVRLDRGDTLTDHHSLNFASIPGHAPTFHHVAFEVVDLDDLMVGHEHLKKCGYKHDWGVGRHILGSQVFDYWKDPFGNRIEHWTDGDVFAAGSPTGVHDLSVLLGQQWGPDAPANFV